MSLTDSTASGWQPEAAAPLTHVAGSKPKPRKTNDLDALEAELDERQQQYNDWLIAEAEAQVRVHWEEYVVVCQGSCDLPTSWAQFHAKSIHGAIFDVEDRRAALLEEKFWNGEGVSPIAETIGAVRARHRPLRLVK
jgi:hypothetical protein